MRLGVLMPFFLSIYAVSLFSDNTGSVYIVEIEAHNVQERSKIAELIHIDSVVEDRVFSVVNQGDLKALASDKKIKLVSVETVQEHSGVSSYYQPFVGVIEFPHGDEAFHTYDETVAALRALESKYGNLVQMFSIGKSIQDRDIWGIRISDDSAPDATPKSQKKAIVYMGTHHAREHVSTEIPIMLAEELLNNSLTDSATQALLKNIEIYVIPIVNPDGTIHDIEGKNYKWWRKNRRKNSDGSYGVDLNRNYAYGWGTGGSSSNPSSEVYMGRSAFSEPETQAIRDFFVAHSNVTIALSFHTFSELVLYPWGGQHNGVGGQDELLFKKMAGDIAAMNNYTPMQSSGLYIASGDTCDWLYGELSVYCFTFELSPSSMFDGGFYPGASIIDKVFDDNWEPIMYLANLTDNPLKALE